MIRGNHLIKNNHNAQKLNKNMNKNYNYNDRKVHTSTTSEVKSSISESCSLRKVSEI